MKTGSVVVLAAAVCLAAGVKSEHQGHQTYLRTRAPRCATSVRDGHEHALLAVAAAARLTVGHGRRTTCCVSVSFPQRGQQWHSE